MIASNIQTRDTFGRQLRDLRLSVVDACNLRCSYCMPPDRAYHFVKHDRLLSPTEIETLVGLFADLGVCKLRITGGEPLLRRELEEIVTRVAKIDGIREIALTTNGLLLKQHAAALATAGVQRVTVSLDTIDPEGYAAMSGVGACVARVLEGIDAARAAGLAPIKINTVVQRGVNEDGILDLVDFARETGSVLRFIEYMDVGNLNGWRMADVVPSLELLARIQARYPLTPLDPTYHGEVASRYRYEDGRGEIGFISSVTEPFCRTCNRARISAVGTLYTCLFSCTGLDLLSLIRSGAGAAELRERIQAVWHARDDRYSEERTMLAVNQAPREKVEMYTIGG
jgi:cyclic pyranopterin phosphate synthase